MFPGEEPPPPPGAQLPDRILASGHTESIRVTAFNPDGSMLATGSADETIRLWDPRSGRTLRTLAGHEREVTSLAFSPDGRRLASSSPDMTVRVWDTRTGAPLFTLDPACFAGEAVFSHDGSLVVFDCPDAEEGGLQIASAADGTILRRIPSKWQVHRHLVATPDGSIVGVGITEGCDTTLSETVVWDPQTGKKRTNLPVSAEAIRPDGRRLAAIEYSKKGTHIAIHDGATGKRLRTIAPPDPVVDHLTFSRDGSRLLATLGRRDPDSNATIAVWDTNSGKQVATLPGDKDDDVETLAISPDGKLVVTSNWDRMHVWDLPAATLVRKIAGKSRSGGSLVFDREGRLLVSVEDGVRIWNVATGEEVGMVPGVGGGRLVFSEDGNWLASNPAGKINVWSTKDWTLGELSPPGSAYIWSFGFSAAPGAPAIGLSKVSNWKVTSAPAAPGLFGSTDAMAISPGGKLLAAARRQTGEVEVWNLETSALLASFLAHSRVHGLEFSPDGKVLLTAGSEVGLQAGQSEIRLWDVGTWRATESLVRTSVGLTLGKFSSDGRLLAITGVGQTELFDIQSRIAVRKLATGEFPSGEMAFSPDGQWFAALSQDGVQVWNIRR
jgi:WD40 repeat protein